MASGHPMPDTWDDRGRAWTTRRPAPVVAHSVMASPAKLRYGCHVSTMNVSLPRELKTYVDDRVNRSGYGSTSEYVRDLIRRDHDHQHLRNLLLDGASSDVGPIADDAYFSALRDRIAPDA